MIDRQHTSEENSCILCMWFDNPGRVFIFNHLYIYHYILIDLYKYFYINIDMIMKIDRFC